MAGSAEHSKRTGLTKGATNEYQEKSSFAHTGGGNQTNDVTLGTGTTKWLKKVELAAPSFTGAEYVEIYDGTVAAGTKIKEGYLLPSGVIEFRNPVEVTVVGIRVNSSAASTVYINIDYDYA